MFQQNLTETVGHRGQFGHLAPSWMEDDAEEVHHPDAEGCVSPHAATVTIKWLQECFGQRFKTPASQEEMRPPSNPKFNPVDFST